MVRAQNWLALVEAKKVYLVQAPWVRSFLEEVEVFPDGDHDDQVDSVSILYELLFLSARILVG